MSSVPGRSDSQRSYTKGEDQISVRRVSDEEQEFEGRRKSGVESFRSSLSLSRSDDSSLHDSCVLKHFSKHRSSHLRFLAWVAYTRRFSNDAITDEERRTCPLLWCRTEFADQESMLQHVWNCPHLSKGLYWCFHCQKHERLGKFHKKCIGAPSKTDRIANVAKKIFSKLGASTHRKGIHPSSSEGSFVLNNSWKSTDVKDPNLFRESPMWDDTTAVQELPDTSICSEMAADWTAACQELADTSIMAMVEQNLSSEASNGVDMFGQQDNYYAETFEESVAAPPAPRSRSATPKLPRLDTSMSPLYRGEWKYPVQNPQPRTTAHQGFSRDYIVSPLSPGGPSNPNLSLEVSPTETVASGASFFTDSGYTSATSAGENSQCPSRVPSTKRTWECASIPEEHYLLDQVAPVAFPASLPSFEQVLTESLFSTPSVSRSSSNASDKSKAKDLSPHWSDAQTLVQSFSEVLDEQIAHTKGALHEVPPNQITTEILALSKTSVVSIGLEVLAGILEGRQPTSIVQIFSFTQIACACAITSDPENDMIHKSKWFEDSMAWIAGISSPRHQQLYTDVANLIWQPSNSLANASPSETSSYTPQSNLLLKMCQHFLDILEHYNMQDEEAKTYQTPSSGFDFTQLTFELNGVNRVIDKLKCIKTIEGFMSDIITVGEKLRCGRLKNTRALELELICSAKVSSRSHIVYDRFLNHVATLCDDLYMEEIDSSSSRTAHQIRDITLIKRYLPEDIYDHDNQMEEHMAGLDMSFDECFDFVGASVEGQTALGLDFDCTSNSFNYPSLAVDVDMSEKLSCPASTSKQQYNPPSTPPVPMFQFTSPSPPAAPIAISQIPTLASTTKEIQGTADTSPQESPFSTTPSTGVLDRYKCFCGYVPSGEEKWKASNLRRHKRTQHADVDGGTAKTYKCQWMGCKSVFTRSDNLRSHQRARGHGDYAASETGLGGGSSRATGGPQGKKQKLEDCGSANAFS